METNVKMGGGEVSKRLVVNPVDVGEGLEIT